MAAVADYDDYNWGYDPVHWGVPDGSYATDPDGPSRLIEFRRMVGAIHAMGLRVVLDVVYNHTFRAGPHDDLSVLDKVRHPRLSGPPLLALDLGALPHCQSLPPPRLSLKAVPLCCSFIAAPFSHVEVVVATYLQSVSAFTRAGTTSSFGLFSSAASSSPPAPLAPFQAAFPSSLNLWFLRGRSIASQCIESLPWAEECCWSQKPMQVWGQLMTERLASHVFPQIVPGYYHRRGEAGNLLHTCCCNNTATEHAMCERLVVDDCVYWAKSFKVSDQSVPCLHFPIAFT